MSCEKAIFKQLRARGMRLTPQREIVLSVMHRMEDFSTAEQIHDQVQGISSSIDISTVYRTLDLFQNFHAVAVVEANDGQRRYKLSGLSGPHLHLVCRRCGAVEGISLEQAQGVVACLEAYSGFQVDLDDLSIPGLCEACQAAQDQETE
jgi:Fur family ferric uptake transcriptional regulator